MVLSSYLERPPVRVSAAALSFARDDAVVAEYKRSNTELMAYWINTSVVVEQEANRERQEEEESDSPNERDSSRKSERGCVHNRTFTNSPSSMRALKRSYPPWVLIFFAKTSLCKNDYSERIKSSDCDVINM
jgi:hypothetical protein